jgi:hypothetical protein
MTARRTHAPGANGPARGRQSSRDPRLGSNPPKAPRRDALTSRLTRRDERQIRYVLYRSYVLFVNSQIEPISEHLPDQVPLGKAQRLDREAYESPALPLSYSAAVCKLTERAAGPQPRPIEHISIEQHISMDYRRKDAGLALGYPDFIDSQD